MAAGLSNSNVSSKRLHEKVGFEVMGKRPVRDGQEGMAVAIWQGAGRVEKEDTIYRDNEM
jgi:L-amino acid N-acyltransferase YncA